ncbi:hypothetical protein BPAE_0076g00020 [Botrytis paeoniae]|uniref:DUF7779 domain-containing protein n=1 Tax=Botrytis paeoniae TaxID=278948 RepID=A0A4Z1FV64_9HELO|nr:hypothetical protein BPAE_0076g00020 [Botrytis paeoniae]
MLLLVKRLETPPNPSIVISFSRDKDFVERGTILDLIYEKFTGSGSRTAFIGLSGTGFLAQAQSIGRDRQRNENIENSQPLITYLPQCHNGSVLVTTQSRSVVLKLVEQRDIIAVEPMGMIDALALFWKKLGQCDNGNNTAELVETLDLLHHNGEQLRRDWEANNSILVTWQISFDCIRKTRSSAADLLSLMSFFDRQGIPEALLRSRNTDRSLEQNQESDDDDDDDDENDYSSVSTVDSDDDEDNSLGSSINDGFEDDILVLRDYSFISVNADRTTFEMHRLVQLATRKWLEDQKQQEKWKRQFIKNLDAELPTGEYENWVQCQMLFPHAQSAIVHKPEEQNSLVEWASILYKASWYAREMGNGKDAENLNKGQWNTAEQLEVQVMETRKKKFGVDHPDTLTSMANLAYTWKGQDRHKEALKLLEECVVLQSRSLGINHPDTLFSRTNLLTWRTAEPGIDA